MEIKPQFEIHNLVSHKFETGTDKMIIVYEVMEIRSQTCYAGTQIFYQVRPIHLMSEYKTSEWVIAPGFANEKQNSENGWLSFREDELINAPQKLIDLVIANKLKQ